MQHAYIKLLNHLKQLNQCDVSTDVYTYAKNDIPQFSLDIVVSQYWKLLLACLGVPYCIDINRLNQNDISLNA